jgi:DNA-directed RNA polymerase
MKKLKTISSSLQGRRKSISIRKFVEDKIDLRKQNEAIVPNLVHSFDASNISLLIKGLDDVQNNINMLTIHDCFATDANNVDLMVLHVKMAFM